jgi:microcompartment protein CcmK/EutM
MRLGIVRGTVVLNLVVPELVGTRLLIVEPVTGESLARADGSGGGKMLVVADQLNPAEGQMIAFVEAREAANPFPGGAPVDAYCSLIVETFSYQPPRPARGGSGKPGPAESGKGT